MRAKLFVAVNGQQYMGENPPPCQNVRQPEYAASYSPWSCDTFVPYIGTKDMKSKDCSATGYMEMVSSMSNSVEFIKITKRELFGLNLVVIVLYVGVQEQKVISVYSVEFAPKEHTDGPKAITKYRSQDMISITFLTEYRETL